MIELEKLVDVSSSWVGMVETFMREPNGRTTALDDVQKKVFNVMQFGDDPRIISPAHMRPHYYVMMNWPRQFGKTYTVAKMASIAAVIHDGLHIGCYGPHDKRAKILLKKIKDNLKYSSFVNKVMWKTKSKEHLETVDNSSIDSFNTSELLIRGDTEDMQLIDEGDYILDNDLILDAIEPKTLIPRTHGWGKILMISTPNMKNENSVFKQWYFEALASRKMYCQVCGRIRPLSDFLSQKIKEDSFSVYEMPQGLDNCSCGSKKFVYYYDSEKMVIPVDPKSNPRIPWAALEAKLASRNWSPKARQEYLGEIVPGAGGMFPLDVLVRIEDARLHNYDHPPRGWDPEDHVLSAGLDYGKTHDNTVFTIFEQFEDNKINLLSMKVLDSEIENPSWEEIRRFVRGPLSAWNPQRLVVDCTGLGSESAERMVSDIEEWDLDTVVLDNKKNHTGFILERKSKQDLVSNMEEKIKATMVFTPPVFEPEMRELRAEFLNFGYEVTKASNVIYHAMHGKDDRVMSFGLGLMGYEQDAFPPMMDKVWSFGR
jgi:hypothetical protein